MKKETIPLVGDGVYVSEKCGIYAVVSPEGKIYIGQSKDIPTRVRHYKKGKYATGKLKISLFNFGRSSHFYYLLEKLPDSCSLKTMHEREKYHISKFKNAGYELLNCNGGGAGGNGHWIASAIIKQLSYDKFN